MTMITTDNNPPYIERILNLPAMLEKRSHFLLGPRQTGKTFLIRHALTGARVYNLLDTSLYLALSHRPERLAQELTPQDRVVVIDEIQRLPELLNEVHRLIEERGIRFLLTGSSARKLRRGGVNLLGGRARTKHLHPLTYRELGPRFDLVRAIERGLIPSIYFSDDPRADLHAYAGSYLQQEIAAEGVTRNVLAFSRFLRVAALCNGTIVHFTNVANDAGDSGAEHGVGGGADRRDVVAEMVGDVGEWGRVGEGLAPTATYTITRQTLPGRASDGRPCDIQGDNK
jgi:predicted AAA+ superfamily ATPase